MTPISRRLYAVAAIALAAVIFVALNIAVDATFTSTKIDLTENGLYTLADGTKKSAGRETTGFSPQTGDPSLKYDLTALIYKLAEPKKPVLGIISSLPLDTGAGGMQAMLQGQAQPFAIYQELAATYDTKMIDQ